MSGTPDHPIEEWTDEELLDQLVFVRGELADREPVMNADAETSPVAAIEEEIERRGLTVPPGSDPRMPGRENTQPAHRDADED
jgi:hypothetical protein